MLGQRREDKLDIRDSEQGEVKAVEDQTPRICCIDTKPAIAGTVKSAHSKPEVNQTKQTPFSPLSPSATTSPPTHTLETIHHQNLLLKVSIHSIPHRQ